MNISPSKHYKLESQFVQNLIKLNPKDCLSMLAWKLYFHLSVIRIIDGSIIQIIDQQLRIRWITYITIIVHLIDYNLQQSMFGNKPSVPTLGQQGSHGLGGMFNNSSKPNADTGTPFISGLSAVKHLPPPGESFFLNQRSNGGLLSGQAGQPQTIGGIFGKSLQGNSFLSVGNMGSPGGFGSNMLSNNSPGQFGSSQAQPKPGAFNKLFEDSQQQNFIKGGLFHQPAPGEGPSSQPHQQKVSHGQYTALSLGLFGQTKLLNAQVSNSFGSNSNNNGCEGEGKNPFFKNQQSNMFSDKNIPPTQSFFNSHQKQQNFGQMMAVEVSNTNTTKFSLPRGQPGIFPSKKSFQPIIAKNTQKLKKEELVMCIAAYDQFEGLSKQQIRIQYILSGGQQPMLICQQSKLKQNNGNHSFGQGLSSFLGGGSSKIGLNDAFLQELQGQIGNQNPNLTKIWQSNTQPDTIIKFPSYFGPKNPQKQPQPPSNFFSGCQSNTSNVIPCFGVNNVEKQQHSFPVPPSLNVQTNFLHPQQQDLFSQSSNNLFQQPTIIHQYLPDHPSQSLFGTASNPAAQHPSNYSLLCPFQAYQYQTCQQETQNTNPEEIKSISKDRLLTITDMIAHINTDYHPSHHQTLYLDQTMRNKKQDYRTIFSNKEIEQSGQEGYDLDMNHGRNISHSYGSAYENMLSKKPKDKQEDFCLIFDKKYSIKPSNPIKTQLKLTPQQLDKKKQEQFLTNLPIIGKFSTFPSFERLKHHYTCEQLKSVNRFKIWNQFGSIEFREPISLIKVNLEKNVSICQDCIEITDYNLQAKKFLMTFNNFGNYANQDQKEQRKLKRKIRNWIEINGLREILHDSGNGNLIVEPQVRLL